MYLNLSLGASFTILQKTAEPKKCEKRWLCITELFDLPCTVMVWWDHVYHFSNWHTNSLLINCPFLFKRSRLRDINDYVTSTSACDFYNHGISLRHYRIVSVSQRCQTPFTDKNNISNSRLWCKCSWSRTQLVEIVKFALLLQDPATNNCTAVDKAWKGDL